MCNLCHSSDSRIFRNYPIEMTPVFFQKIHPLLPSLMELLRCVKQLQACMEVFISTTFLIFALLRSDCTFNRTGNKTSSGRTEPPVRPEAVWNRIYGLRRTDDQLSRSAQLSYAFKASLSQDDLRTQTAEKAQKFLNRIIGKWFAMVSLRSLLFRWSSWYWCSV
mgnify:CR=1 FL=1